jgi:hypothetical protein
MCRRNIYIIYARGPFPSPLMTKLLPCLPPPRKIWLIEKHRFFILQQGNFLSCYVFRILDFFYLVTYIVMCEWWFRYQNCTTWLPYITQKIAETEYENQFPGEWCLRIFLHYFSTISDYSNSSQINNWAKCFDTSWIFSVPGKPEKYIIFGKTKHIPATVDSSKFAMRIWNEAIN